MLVKGGTDGQHPFGVKKSASKAITKRGFCFWSAQIQEPGLNAPFQTDWATEEDTKHQMCLGLWNVSAIVVHTHTYTNTHIYVYMYISFVRCDMAMLLQEKNL